MVDGYVSYQYGTSPKKLQIQDKKYTKRNYGERVKKEVLNKKKKKNYNKTNLKRTFIFYLTVVFFIFLIISYRNSLITEEFNEKERIKKELGSIEKENEQLRVSIESSLNFNNIAAAAEEKLGMKKLDNSQKIYISLPKKDYVEPATEEVVIEEEEKWYHSLISKILGR